MEDFVTIFLWGAIAFGICIWLWYAFDWRWYPGPPMLLAGLLSAALTGGLCVVTNYFPIGFDCQASYNVAKSGGFTLGILAAACVVLLCSPVVAFWRRLQAGARREA
jgi:hypothetical protein